MPPELQAASQIQLETVLATVARRLRWADLLRALATGLFVLSLVMIVRPGASRELILISGASVGLAATGILFWRRRSGWTNRAAAASIERIRPENRNVIVTAEELMRYPGRARPSVAARVIDAATATLTEDVVPNAVSLRRPTLFAGLGVALAAFAASGVPHRAASTVRDVITGARGTEFAAGSAGVRLTATIVPPDYLGMPSRRLDEPERIDAIAGSRLLLELTGPEAMRLRLGARPVTMSRRNDVLIGDVLLTESGYLAVDETADTGSPVRRLVPIAVTADRAPVIRIDQPGKDLLVPDSLPTIPVRASATDDFGLRSLEFRYTKVSGSGEQFEFEEGSLALNVTRDSVRDWNGQSAIALSQLALQPGDAVVYRVTAQDGRPGEQGLATSDTFFIEVAAPGQVALAGFELPPERERYALSQQMIVLKIQRLRARASGLTRPAVAEEALVIAAEQRAVRANFIFLTGGQVEDEEQEAEHSHEIQEGRLEHTARREIGLAIRHMSRADQFLVSTDTGAALASARAAVEALQRAFGRNRYILRNLPVRSRIDPSRRLSGSLADATDGRRDVHSSSPEQASVATRELLASLVRLKPALMADAAPHAAELSSLAEKALAIDPGSAEWQRIAGDIQQIRALAAVGKRDEASSTLREVVKLLIVRAKRDAIYLPPQEETAGPLRSAWGSLRSPR